MKKLITTIVLWSLSIVLTAQTGKGLVTYAKNGVPKFIEFDTKHQALTANPNQVLTQNLEVNPDVTFVKISEIIDKLGRKHEKYQQYCNGLKVAFCVYTMHYGLNNEIVALSGDYAPIDSIANVPRLTEQTCFNQALLSENITNTTETANGELLICRDFNDSNNTYHLAYQFYLADVAKYVYVDAVEGNVLCNYSVSYNAVGDVCTRYSGMVANMNTEFNGIDYVLHDYTRGQGIYTYDYINHNPALPNLGKPQNFHTNFNSPKFIIDESDFIDSDDDWCDVGVWDNSNPDLDNAALDAHWGLQRIYDYWFMVHNRNSYDGVGGKISAYVHVAGNNAGHGYPHGRWAQWLPISSNLNQTAIIIGDGRGAFVPIPPPDEGPWTSLDILAHEFGHGVAISAFDITPGLNPETAAISESLSDIWGAVVENWVVTNGFNNGTTDIDKDKWIFGEEVRIGGVRSMSNPPSFLGHQDTYLGPGWGAVAHWDGGAMNKWFYLISDGIVGTATNSLGTTYGPIQSIGIEKAADIVYLAMTTYFTSLVDFKDARQATLQAAKDLYGSCSTEAQTVSEAWDAVGVPITNNFSSVLACGTIDGNGNTTGIYDGSGFTNIVVATPNEGGQIFSGSTSCPQTVTVQNGSHVVFKASDKVILEPEFKAARGSNFKAYIFQCSGAGNYRVGNSTNTTNTPIKDHIVTPQKSTLTVYPNPNNGQFNVAINNFDGNVELVLVDLYGKIIYSETSNKNNFTFDLSNYPKGMYLLRTVVNSKLTVQKVIYQ